MRSKGTNMAEYMLPYCKDVVDGQIERNERDVILDISEVAYKFLADHKSVIGSLNLLKEQGYCFVSLGNFEYRFVGMNRNGLSTEQQTRLIKKSLRDNYGEDIDRLIRTTNDKELLLELFVLKKIITH
jgi:hypothetical protein